MRFLSIFLLAQTLTSFVNAASTALDRPPDYRFKVEVLTEGLVQPMELEIASDGRIFFNEIGGKLKVFKPLTGQVILSGEIKVTTAQENGFLGFALDPGFASNRWIFLYYSPTDFVGQRLSRFTLLGDQLQLATETKILEFPEQREDCCHHAGSVEFGPDGNLFISTGDNTHPHGDSAGYAPIDERPGRSTWDAQKSSANTHDLRGKILRIRPKAEGGYTIPPGNLFPADGSQGRPEIFVMGCRNPWRMSIDSKTGFVYWGDVGPDAGSDTLRGPQGYDEINQARRAGNFGWPYFVGSNFAYADFDFGTGKSGSRFDPLAPTNASPNNTGLKILPPAEPAFIYWPYGDSKEFPALGKGGRTACAGPVFHFRPSFKKTGGFPEYFDNSLLFYDWQRPFLKWARLDEQSNLREIESFSTAVTLVNDRDQAESARENGKFVIQRPVDSLFGSDGCLYLIDYGETWGANSDARLIKISYQWGNVSPVAKIEANRTSGPEPLAIQLSSAGSTDFEGDRLRFEWRLHPGAKIFSRQANPLLKIDRPGNFLVELRVNDGRGGVASTSLPVVSGNTVPHVRFVTPQEGDFFSAGEKIRYEVEVKDAEDGRSSDYEEIFEPRTFVTASWMSADGKSKTAAPGLALMKQSDCFNCHAVEQRIVGPSFLEIATRYRQQPGALEASVQRVRHGSSKVWGDIPMLPHESLSLDQLGIMVRWIFSLEPGKGDGGVVRGLTGELTAPMEDSLRIGQLEANFADTGRAPAGSLAGKAVVRLRHRRMEAELADEIKGLKVQGKNVGSIDHGHYLRFSSLDLSTSSKVKFRVASGGVGGRIELRQGALEGPLIAAVEVEPTGSWDKWAEKSVPLSATTARADCYLVFVNPGKGGLMNLDWVEFVPR